jgi:hypothetical protein
LGGNPTDALRGAVRNAEIGFGPPGVPSLGVPEGVGGQGAAPRGTVSVSSLGPPGPNLAQLAQQLFGSPQAQAARSSISADTGDEFGPTNTTKGTGSSTATAANTGKAPGVGGAAVAGGTPSPADFGPARGAMGNVSTASLAGPAIALGGGPGNASESPTGTPAAPSIGPGGIGSDAVAGGSSPNAPPGTPTVANTPGPPGTDPTLGGKAPGYYGMTMGFPAVEGVSPGLTAAPAGPSPAAPTGDPGARGSSAVGTPATDNSPTGDPGLSPHQAAMVQDALDYARANFGPPQIEGQPPAFINAPPEAFTMPNAEPLQPSPLQQLIQSLVSGGAPGPGLSSLAQNAQFGI